MSKVTRYFLWKKPILSLFLFVIIETTQAQAICYWRGPDQGCDACGSSLNFGTIGLMPIEYQPAGAILARTVFSLVPAIKNPDPDHVIYECDKGDENNIYEVFATNGDSNVGGAWDMGDNHFQTFFPFTAVKFVHLNSGLPFTRTWQQVKMTHYEISGNKILIRGRDFSLISAELIRTASNNRNPGYASWGCKAAADDDYTGPYSCNQPNGYVVFKGPGVDVPEAGMDSWGHFYTWASGRYMAFGMNTAPVSILTQSGLGCMVTRYTSNVVFPQVSAMSLNSGYSPSVPITVLLKCYQGAFWQSSHSKSIDHFYSPTVSMAFQAPYPAWLQAKNANLVDSQGLSNYLLSDNYGNDTSLAKGVGISLSTHSIRPIPIPFLGWSDFSADPAWIRILSGRDDHPGSTLFVSKYFLARLTTLPNSKATPGKVNASAYIVVRLQ